jgi:hypothetical protein
MSTLSSPPTAYGISQGRHDSLWRFPWHGQVLGFANMHPATQFPSTWCRRSQPHHKPCMFLKYPQELLLSNLRHLHRKEQPSTPQVSTKKSSNFPSSKPLSPRRLSSHLFSPIHLHAGCNLSRAVYTRTTFAHWQSGRHTQPFRPLTDASSRSTSRRCSPPAGWTCRSS